MTIIVSAKLALGLLGLVGASMYALHGESTSTARHMEAKNVRDSASHSTFADIDKIKLAIIDANLIDLEKSNAKLGRSPISSLRRLSKVEAKLGDVESMLWTGKLPGYFQP